MSPLAIIHTRPSQLIALQAKAKERDEDAARHVAFYGIWRKLQAKENLSVRDRVRVLRETMRLTNIIVEFEGANV